MEVVILCGGKGSRLAEETISKPKPMVEIAGKPILWHIMKIYSNHGYKKFILALGYKANYIKNYFYNSRVTENDFTLKMDPKENVKFHNSIIESDWEITFIDTGEDTLKGARIKKIEKYITGDNFFVTYGDGVSDVDIKSLYKYHLDGNKLATLTAVHPPSRFGEIEIGSDNIVSTFQEKPQMASGYINGGFFVFKKEIFNYLTENNDCDLEFGALQKIASENQLRAFIHNNFWQCMDNVRERDYLNDLVLQKKDFWLKNNKNV